MSDNTLVLLEECVTNLEAENERLKAKVEELEDIVSHRDAMLYALPDPKRVAEMEAENERLREIGDIAEECKHWGKVLEFIDTLKEKPSQPSDDYSEDWSDLAKPLLVGIEEFDAVKAKVEELEEFKGMVAHVDNPIIEELRGDYNRVVARVKELEEYAASQESPDVVAALRMENERLRALTAIKVRGVWHSLDEGQPTGEAMEDLAAIAHDLDEGR